MKKQTAVEWLVEKLDNVRPTQICSIETIKEWCNQAKAMEKEQIIDTYNKAAAFTLLQIGEQYYNETYGK
jgi:hypothetical protein